RARGAALVWRGATAAAALILLAAGSIACDPPRPALMIWGASSLTDVLPRVAEGFEAEEGVVLRFAFDASSRLARQLGAGAPADVFLSADEAWMDFATDEGLVRASSRRRIARNSLVLVVPSGARGARSTLEGLPDVERVAIASEAVPAGRYAEASLRSLGIWASLQPKLVRGTNVRATLAWVARAEVDAGLVYATDARIEPRIRIAARIPEGTHPPITYAAAITSRSERVQTAERFLDYCARPRARELFAEAGFSPPEPPPALPVP
ncbi:MAG: molybdate ABC transporter substrate-binding protein, partial [Myxococcales bacterium]|nr:molybdate ABC transporter substrate-binding protein [Myxococcales bacterium]